MGREILRLVDGRLVLLGFIVVIAGVTARNLQPVKPAGAIAADVAMERAADAVLVEVDHAQLCYRKRRDEYADTIPSLAFAGGHYMRIALQNGLDISLETAAGGQTYTQRVRGVGVVAVVQRRGLEVMRLDVGDRSPPQLAASC
jgi:hypothetical protein